MPHPLPKKSGIAVLVGRSNAGKSTLLNALVGTKLAIVTPKAQTTRRPIQGVLHDPAGQIVFVDTPGVFHGKKDRVSKRLNLWVKSELEGIDAIVYVVDPTRSSGPEERQIQELLRASGQPCIVVINKLDLSPDAKPFLEQARSIDVGQVSTIEISALRGTNLNKLREQLLDMIPEGEPLYPEDQLTNQRPADWLAELIREKAFLCLDEELPYAIHAEVTEFEARSEDRYYAAATIWTTEKRYQGMIIGANGQMVKRIGTDARKEWMQATNKKLFLDLTVAVDAKWPQRFLV